MNIQPPLVSRDTSSASALLAIDKKSDAILFVVVFFTMLCLAPLLVLSGLTLGFSLLLGLLVALTVAIVIVRWPVAGLFIVTACAVLIEETSLRLAPIFTDHLYIFYWPPNLEGMIERPIGFLFLFILFVLVCHRLAKRDLPLQGGVLIIPFLCFMLCVVWGVVHGLSSGGNLKIIVVEVRPFWYLFISYLLGYNLITRKENIKTFFWIVILGAGVKGLQGLYLFFAILSGSLQGHDEMMAHEESFFFVALLLLIVLFCLHYRYRPQLLAALFVLPAVLISLVANQRRADYIALLVGFTVAWILIFLIRPRARKMLVTTLLTTVILGGAYVAAFSHSEGGLASPARSIVAVFSPDGADVRDFQSNLYRKIEDYDLLYTIKQNPALGIGFGKPFLEPVALVDISADDLYYLYIPHNNIYWVWVKLGPFGYLALWYLVGSIIVRGCHIVRRLKDSYLQLVAIYIVAITFMEIIIAFADYQLFFYRNVIYFGVLVGILMRLPKIDDEANKEISSV
jgi:O-antigen ligase